VNEKVEVAIVGCRCRNEERELRSLCTVEYTYDGAIDPSSANACWPRSSTRYFIFIYTLTSLAAHPRSPLLVPGEPTRSLITHTTTSFAATPAKPRFSPASLHPCASSPLTRPAPPADPLTPVLMPERPKNKRN